MEYLTLAKKKKASIIGITITYLSIYLPLVIIFAWPNARDADVYRSGFNVLLNGENPYESSTFRAGLFGSMMIHLMSFPISGYLASIFFLCLNGFGYWLFVKSVVKKENLQAPLFLLIAWSSSSREGLNTIQITGLLLGIFAMSLRFLERGSSSKSLLLVNSLLMAIAIDLKPHISIITFAFLVLKFHARRFTLATLLILTLAHVSINLYFGRVFESDWLRLISTLNKKAGGAQSKDSVNFYYFTRLLSENGSKALIILHLILLLTLLVYVVKNISRFSGGICIAIGATSAFLGPYFHYYDLLPLVGMALMSLLNRKLSFLTGFYVSIIAVTLNPDSIKALGITTFCHLVFLISNHKAFKTSKDRGLLLYLMGATSEVVMMLIIKSEFFANDAIYPVTVAVVYVISLLLVVKDKHDGRSHFSVTNS